jgi:hypothetical protein
MDVPEPSDIPTLPPGLRVEQGDAVLSTDIAGRPLDVRIGEDGVRVEDGRSPEQIARDREAWERVRRQAQDSLREARERAEEAQRQIEEQAGR